jgi:hypothetical protein
MELIFLIAVGFGVYYYLKETRLERQQQKFEKTKRDIELLGRENRVSLASNSQKQDMLELSGIAKEYLSKYEMELPPRLFQATNKKIDEWVGDIRFSDLYDLYELLRSTSKKKVYSELEQFIGRIG